jgi:hypothetical protein
MPPVMRPKLAAQFAGESQRPQYASPVAQQCFAAHAPPHATLHAPQLFASMYSSTQPPLQSELPPKHPSEHVPTPSTGEQYSCDGQA